MNLTDVKEPEVARRIAEISAMRQGRKSAVPEERVLEYFQTSPRFDGTILPRLGKEFPWLHTRSATEDDCYELCRRYGVEVVVRPDVPCGVYVMTEGEHYIFLNSTLRGWMLPYVFCHEIAHFLFHEPTQSSDKGKIADEKILNHLEAEIVAFVLCRP